MASRRILHIITTSFYFLLLLLSLVLPQPAYAQTGSNTGQSPDNPYGLNANFNPSLAIIIVVLISAFFFMGFFSIYIRQCAGDHRNGVSSRPTTIARSRRAALGLDPAVIDTFPTFLYSDVKGLKIGKGALECAVCLSEFEDDETLRLLPRCDHVFHPDCIDTWLASHTTCPVCRSVLLPESGETDTNTVAVDNDSSSAPAAPGVTQAPDEENRGSEINIISNSNNEQEQQQQQQQQQQVSVSVTISVSDDSQPPPPAQNLPARAKMGGKFPRSHSTGHSVVQPGENWERYRLRLPEEVRKQIVNGKLNRARSCAGTSAGDGSVNGGSRRRGYRSGGCGEGSSRGKSLQFLGAKSDRWVFSMAPPFFSRTESVKSPKIITDGEGSSSGNGRSLFTSVKTPFDCMSGKGGTVEEEKESFARPPV